MPPPTYAIVLIERLRVSDRRGVVLLGCDDGDPEVDAVATWNAQEAERQRELRDRFDTWIANVQHNNRWFHGFDDPYRDCFVFKWKRNNMGHRLYGFLLHPQPRTRPRFQLCVLTNHAEKPHAQWETDQSKPEKAETLRTNVYVKAVIGLSFPDGEQGKKQWKN